MQQTPLKIKLDFATRSLRCDDRVITLPPRLFAVYAFFVRQNAPCPPQVDKCPYECQACALSWENIESRNNEIASLHRLVESKTPARGNSGILNLSAENFRSIVSHLKKHLPDERLYISTQRSGGKTTYALRIPRGRIRIVYPYDNQTPV